MNSCIESIQNELEVNDTTDSQKSASYLLTLPEYFRSPPVFSGVRVTRYLALCVCFVDRCLFFCTFSLAIVLSVLLQFSDSEYLLVSSNSS